MPFFNGGHIWLILILAAVLLIFGPGKLPELGSAVGRTLQEFKRSTSEMGRELQAHKEHDTTNAADTEARPATSRPGA